MVKLLSGAGGVDESMREAIERGSASSFALCLDVLAFGCPLFGMCSLSLCGGSCLVEHRQRRQSRKEEDGDDATIDCFSLSFSGLCPSPFFPRIFFLFLSFFRFFSFFFSFFSFFSAFGFFLFPLCPRVPSSVAVAAAAR